MVTRDVAWLELRASPLAAADHHCHCKHTSKLTYKTEHTFLTTRQQSFAVCVSCPKTALPLKNANEPHKPPQVLKCQMRDFIARNPEYVSFLAQRQGLDAPSVSHASSAEDQPEEHGRQSDVVFWERAVGGRLSGMFRQACCMHMVFGLS